MIANSNISSNQQTIRKSFSLNGIGLHSGKKVKITVEPAKVNNGIKFIRTDLTKDNIVPALWSNVSSTNLCTTISNEKGVSVSTIEHLMSSLSGMHIDNANILINNLEVPIMDGSSLPFVEELENSGIEIQEVPRKIISVKKEIFVSNNDSYANGIGAFGITFSVIVTSSDAQISSTNNSPFFPKITNPGINYEKGQVITKNFATKLKLGTTSLVPISATVTTSSRNDGGAIGSIATVDWDEYGDITVTGSGQITELMI